MRGCCFHAGHLKGGEGGAERVRGCCFHVKGGEGGAGRREGMEGGGKVNGESGGRRGGGGGQIRKALVRFPKFPPLSPL